MPADHRFFDFAALTEARRHANGCETLAMAVIWFAWCDLASDDDAARASAERFFLSDRDTRLPFWSAIVGVDVGALRVAVRRRLAGASRKHLRRGALIRRLPDPVVASGNAPVV